MICGLPTAKETWKKHVLGALAIVRTRGPHGFTTPTAIYLFQGVRYGLVSTASRTL